MFEQNENQNNLIKNDTLASIGSSVGAETKTDRAATKEELRDLEISFDFEKIELIKKLLIDIQNNITRVVCLLEGEDKVGLKKEELIKTISNFNSDLLKVPELNEVFPNEQKGERIIEGVFNGKNMIGADGQEYTVPENYASKSKLVEGDLLKLSIDSKGAFVYKQIGPIERTRIVGTLAQGKDEESFVAVSQGKRWRVLTASVTYFKGVVGDEVVILVPKNTPSRWAAVENIIKKSER